MASFIAAAITSAALIPSNNLSGVTATATGAVVQLGNVQTVECNITSDIQVGQPTNSFGSRCSHCCSDRIGVVYDARLDLDVALIQIDSGRKYRAEIPGIGFIKDTLDITTKVVGYPLQKRGAITGLTKGTLLALDKTGFATSNDEHNQPPGWQLLARYYQGAFSILDGLSGFSAEGDSGAAVMTNPANSGDPDNNKIAGIVFGSGSNFTVATPILSIISAFSKYSMSIATATATGVDQVVPPYPASASAVHSLVAGERVAADPIAPRLRQAEREISATPGGRRLADLAQRHFDEAQMLVNTNRRVAAVWRRNGGPQIVSGLLRMANSNQASLPPEIQGKPLADCLAGIHKVFAKYGNWELTADLDRHSASITHLAHLSYPEVLAALRAPETRPGMGS